MRGEGDEVVSVAKLAARTFYKGTFQNKKSRRLWRLLFQFFFWSFIY